MGALGAYIGPPLRDTMVIRLGVGPGRLSLRQPSSPPTAGARRLVGPVDWPGAGPSALVRRGRVLPAADHCSHASNDAGLVMRSWQQCRRLMDDHCRHSPSCLVNGMRGPWEGPSDFKRPIPTGPSCGALAVFCIPANGWDPPSLGRTGRPSWAQCAAHGG